MGAGRGELAGWVWLAQGARAADQLLKQSWWAVRARNSGGLHRCSLVNGIRPSAPLLSNAASPSLCRTQGMHTWLAGRVTGVRGMDAERYEAPGGATSS